MSAKNVLKRAVNAGARGALAPFVALYRLESTLVAEARREAIFQSFSQIVSAIPGYTGQYVRRAFYHAVLPQCHEHSCIHWGTVFTARELYIAEGVYIGARCMIGRARLERHVTIGSNVDILSGKRQHSFDDLDVPIQDQGGTYENITIGENSWIGNGAVILANVGRRSIVAAGAVVVQPVPDEAIVAGNPARVIRHRGADHARRGHDSSPGAT